MLTIPAQPAVAHFSVLLVGADATGCAALRSTVLGMQCEVEQAATFMEAMSTLMTGDIPVVVTDSKLRDGDWRTLVHEAHRLRVPPSVIVVSDSTDSRLWADVLAAGGYDTLCRPWTGASATAVLQGAFWRWQRAQEIEAARQHNALTLTAHALTS
jgi:DNA-binding response OmpR family regulator